MRVWKTTSVSSWTRPNCFPLKTFFSLPLNVRNFRPFLLLRAFARTSARQFTIQLWNCIGSRNFADASPRWDYSELSCHLSTRPKAWSVIYIRLICRLDVFSSLSLKSKVKVLIAMVLRSHNSQFLLFSESSTSSGIPDGVAKFLESLCNSSGSRRACWRSETFPGILILSRVFRGIPTSRLGFPEIEVIGAWWGT